VRLDEALVARKLSPSRSRARDSIKRGTVFVNGDAARKPSQAVQPTDVLRVEDSASHYVSRAALKLLHGLLHFNISASGRNSIDIGASTGGFTQVLLERGAAHVIAIDVGHGQMVPALAQDARVTLIEGLNAREITRAHMPEDVSLIVCDVSFISLKLALPAALHLAAAGTDVLALIKPQFEVGRGHVGKGGVVTDALEQQRACEEVVAWLKDAGWIVKGVVDSPIEGGDGNREFLMCAVKA
jgi:23S rRNA (cytidine1920-2'-O)/16S rRNA (cytidine1409-2'-O)-methyltransferase